MHSPHKTGNYGLHGFTAAYLIIACLVCCHTDTASSCALTQRAPPNRDSFSRCVGVNLTVHCSVGSIRLTGGRPFRFFSVIVTSFFKFLAYPIQVQPPGSHSNRPSYSLAPYTVQSGAVALSARSVCDGMRCLDARKPSVLAFSLMHGGESAMRKFANSM